MRLESTLMICAAAWMSIQSSRAEYHAFDKADDLQAATQEVRWPYWAETTYNAIHSLKIHGKDGVNVYCYGGVPFASPGYPSKGNPASIIWSFWPPKGMTGASVVPVFTGPNTYAPPHVGEGASGKTTGLWPEMQTGTWYRFVMRIWKPADGSTDHGFAAQWFRDSKTGVWHHYATMRLPFAPERMEGLGGFIEDARNKNRKPRRTDYRNVYYLRNGAWISANHFNPSVRRKGERGKAELIENGSAAYFENCSSPDYSGNLDFDAGKKRVSLDIKQSPKPSLDPITITKTQALASANRIAVNWEMAPTSSPQFAWIIEGFDNVNGSGKPLFTKRDIDPSARFDCIEGVPGSVSHVRLTITDVFDQKSAGMIIPVSKPTPSPTAVVSNDLPGLNFCYYESPIQSLRTWKPASPACSGSVAGIDLTPRLRREQYAFEFSGFINVPLPGLYVFTLRSADGSTLEIDGRSVIDHDGIHSPSDRSGAVVLSQGKHPVRLQYFFDKQVSKARDDIDQLSLRWSGPGFKERAVPASAWSNEPIPEAPQIAIIAPGSGTQISSGSVSIRTKLGQNAQSIRKVRFYADDYCLGEDDSTPYEIETPLWIGNSIHLRARAFFGNQQSIDSPPCIVNTKASDTAPWKLSTASDHVVGYSGSAKDGNLHLTGDGLNLLTREIKGDCTLTAHVADLPAGNGGNDSREAHPSWRAGIILRSTLDATPGSPLGNPKTPYAAAFSTVKGDTHFQNHTLRNGGGAHPSPKVGAQRWLRIQRRGNQFTTSVSTDGKSWQECSSTELADAPTTLHAGVFTYAATSGNTNVHRAIFEHVDLHNDR